MAGTTTQTKSTQTKLRGSMTEETITNLCYTKEQVDAMVAEAVEEARRIDEASMAEHNLKATIISMVLGFICLALFLDGTLRLLGIIPPFLDIDISIVDKIAEKVQTEVMPMIQDASQKAQKYIPGR